MLRLMVKFIYLSYPGLIALAFIFLPFIISNLFNISLSNYGLHPRSFQHMYGILTMPFIHNDLFHLFNNATALFVVIMLLYYFYRKHFYFIIVLIWLLSGFWTWILARDGIHIGASAIIYGLTSFLFFSGIFIRNKSLVAISLLVVFLYGSLIWGIFPFFPHVSWEGHLSGFLSGIILSIYFKNEFKSIYSESDENDENSENNEITDT